jgi:predicted ATPase/class 3 adenylate cyclase
MTKQDVSVSADERQDALPTGTMTFLLTDVQDSTRLWDLYPQQMRIALPRHDALIEDIVMRHRGQVVRPRGEGDSRFCVFARPTDAMASAADIQRELYQERWGLPEPLRVHLAVHTGEADLREGDYYGTSVNRCARLRGLAHGGQILFSASTHDLVHDAPDGWPPGTRSRALGEFRLVGLTRPERIFELLVDDVPLTFPPLAVETELMHNLRGQLTSFVGRERELAVLGQRLLDPNVRLMTLTGPGGVGKTRLAQQVGGQLVNAFNGGVCFVSLVSTTNPELVPGVIAKSLGIFDTSSRSVVETLIAKVSDRELLLILDNFEQVRAARLLVVELIEACRNLKVLITSRTRLHVSAEHRLEVRPLEVPGPDAAFGEVERGESVQLFVERARAADAYFALTPSNADAVRDICRKVEGLPLAIELVAARVAEYNPKGLNAHLSVRQLALLTGGPDDVPDRHQTLRAAITWSYDLLAESQRQLFRRLAVFVRGCTRQDAETVCLFDIEPSDRPFELSALAETSLLRVLRAEDVEPRFMMLETVREFALEKLDLDPDAEPIRERHARTFAALLDEAAEHRDQPGDADSLKRLAAELDNLRAAMRWALDHGQFELALHMADAAWPFMLTYGYTHEGLLWSNEILRLTAQEAMPLRARVALGAGWLNHQLGALRAGQDLFVEALATARRTGDLALTTAALGGLAFVVHEQGNFAEALRLADEALAAAEQLGGGSQVARALARRAEFIVLSGDVERGGVAAERAIAAAEAIGHSGGIAAAQDTLGLARRLGGHADEAVQLLVSAVALHESLGYKANAAEAMLRLADALLLQGNIDRATDQCLSALKLAREAANQRRIAGGLRVAASLAVARGDVPRAARLVRAAGKLFAELGCTLTPVEKADLDSVMMRISTCASSGPGGVQASSVEELLAEILTGN